MVNIKIFFPFILLTGILASCAPRAVTAAATPAQPTSTGTSLPPTATLTFTPLPTETAFPSDTPTPTTPSCAVPMNPVDRATVPARGPFDFTWTSFAGAASYVISIGPADWFPTNFPVNGTTLTRYMESFPSSPSYEWSISAIDATGREICKSGPYSFVTSADLSATPSFVISNVSVPESESPSSGGSSDPSGKAAKRPDDSSPPSAGSADFDSSVLILWDGDSEDCRLSVGFRVRINQEFAFFKLIYGFSQGSIDGSVDLSANSLEPYPAYNTYTAVTDPLPVHQGDTVFFGTWYKTVSGAQSKGLTLLHAMSHCSS